MCTRRPPVRRLSGSTASSAAEAAAPVGCAGDLVRRRRVGPAGEAGGPPEGGQGHGDPRLAVRPVLPGDQGRRPVSDPPLCLPAFAHSKALA